MLHGFHIIDPEYGLPKSNFDNHKSALQNRTATEEHIRKGVKKGHYVQCDFQPDIVSPLALVPKQDGGSRLIHDCSLPVGGCLNDFAVDFQKCTYESVDSAVQNLQQGHYLAKVDISAAYRGVAIHPSSYSATGIKWDFDGRTQYFVDTRLPFGARASPTIFHRISQFVKRAMLRKGHKLITAYQDDFLVQGSTYEECLSAWLALINLLLKLGFDINYGKLVAPTTDIIFLGVNINSETMQLSLPLGKLTDIQQIVSEFMGRQRATKKQLQSLAGKLNHAARVVRGGRTFLRRILNCINKLQRPFHKAKLTGAIQKDIEWWHSFLQQFNGVATCIDYVNTVTVVSDSCLVGGGAFCSGDFKYVHWAADYPALADLPINYKETAMVALAVSYWAPYFANKTVVIYSDNQCAVAIINKCACRSDSVMQMLRQMFWDSAKYNFCVKAIYLPGDLNRIADSASRLHEGGQLLLLESYVNEWFLCHHSFANAFDHYSMLNHMSMSALCFIFDQVSIWRRLRHRWMNWW